MVLPTKKSFIGVVTLLVGLIEATITLAMPPPPPPPPDGPGSLICSTNDAPKANINEIRNIGGGTGNLNFLEIFIIEQNVNIEGWRLCTQDMANGNLNGVSCTSLGTGQFDEYYYGNPQGTDASPNPGVFSTGTYLVQELASNDSLNPSYAEVLLINSSNEVVDFIRYCNDPVCTSTFWSVPSACGFELANHDPNEKDIARLPDGTGAFQDNGNAVTIGDTNDDSPLIPLAYYAMDETSWGSGNDDVTELFNGLHGTSVNGANTADSNRAIGGNPGTCGYGDFDGNNDYIAVPGFPDLTGSFTITAWINPDQTTSFDQRIFADDETPGARGYALSLGDGGTGRLRFFSRNVSPVSLDSNIAISSVMNWYHVAAVHDVNAKTREIFVDGISVTNGPQPYSGTWGTDPGRASIGGETGPPNPEATPNWRFDGSIDELKIFNGVLNSAQINQVKDETHPCEVSQTHYAISGSSTGISCLANQITITAHDSSNPHGVVNVTAGTTLNLTAIDSTPTARGSWSAVATGGGSGDFTATTGNNGVASYIWPGDESAVTLLFNYTSFSSPSLDSESVAINISDSNGLSEDAGEDLSILFSRAGFNFSTIPTQISGKPSNQGFNATTLNIQAVRASDDDPSVCVAAFPSGTEVDIELGAKCINPSTCAGNVASINGTPIDTTNAAATDEFEPITLNFMTDDGGLSTFANYVLNYPDAGQLQLKAQYNIPLGDGSLSGDFMTGTSNPFVVRPFAFTLSNIINAGPDGVLGNGDDISNPAGTASTGDGFIAAQDTFAATISSVQWQPGEDDDNNGIPDSDAVLTDNPLTQNFNSIFSLTPTNPSPTGGTTGSLLGSTSIDFTGVGADQITVTDLTYNEAGGITLSAEVLDYLGAVDADISGAALVGRFFPDYLSLDSSSVTAANNTFTYMGQDGLLLSYTLTARGSNGSILSNYDAGLGYAGTATVSTSAENTNDGTSLDARISDPAGSWVAGSYIVTNASETFSRSAAGPDGPYQDLQIGVRVESEMDGRNIENLDQKTDQNNDCVTDTNCTSRAIGSSTDVRYGRLRVNNAFGSELVNLPVQLIAEYFVADGGEGGFVLNTDDNSTSYSALDTGGTTDVEPVTLSNFIGNLGSPASPPNTSASGGGTGVMLSGGLSNSGNPIMLAAPGNGNDGSVDITIDVPGYLEYDWDNDGLFDNDPTGTATFGIFSGNDSTIYLRELY